VDWKLSLERLLDFTTRSEMRSLIAKIEEGHEFGAGWSTASHLR
jgi:hypothetical protein